MHQFHAYQYGKHISTFVADTPDPKEARKELISKCGVTDSVKVRRVWQKEYVLQGDFGIGWEDICSNLVRKDTFRDYKDHCSNAPEYAYRTIMRKVQV